MNDWRELLCRALDGEPLSDREAAQLRSALDVESNWEKAAAWIQFEQAASAQFQDEAAKSSARERLLAKAILREQHARVVGRSKIPRVGSPAGRKSVLSWIPIALAAAAIVIVALLWRGENGPIESYDPPIVRGDFHILGPADAGKSLGRGDRLVSGGKGAQLALGGYCDVKLVSHSDVTLHGEPGREAIELHQGGMRARVTPNQGEFRVLTPLGPVDVKGTEFETTVEYPNGLPGDLSMNNAGKKVIVTVAVLSGMVWCQLGDVPILLEAGANRTFAGEDEGNRTKGEVTATRDLSVTLKVGDDTVTFAVPKTNKLAVHEVGSLLIGDQVTVSWVEEAGKKWVRDVDGEGVIEGEVSALGDAWIEIEPAGGRKLRLRAPWRGGNPSDGGGPDRDVVEKIGKTRVGDRVKVTWTMPEGKRITDIAVTKPGESVGEDTPNKTDDLTKAPPELYGLSGRVIGRLVNKDVEKGELTLKIVKVERVWKNNKAKNPKSAEGRTLKIDGVFGKFLDVLLTMDEGDGLQIEVKHVRGDGLTFLGEELKKVALPAEDEKPKDEPQEKNADAPAGLAGFRGILIGQLVGKDVEKGTLTFKMEKVKRVWKANKAPNPEKSVGKELEVEGVAGKFLDTLLVLEVGDRIEVEAFHVRGPKLKFPGEWLKKAE